MSDKYDVVIVGGGHNGLVAAAYLAQAGRDVLLLERRDELGGAAVSGQAFEGVDVRLSRYSYLVGLLPQKIIDDLRLPLTLRRRRVSSYTPAGDDGLLVDGGAESRTAASFARIAGIQDFDAWQRFYGMTRHVAERVFPTMTEPLPTRAALRRRVGDSAAWRTLFEEPIGAAIEKRFSSDTVRGVVATDALIGTFADTNDADLRQNRCFLYHVIGNGTGDWDVPVGGMGAVTAALTEAAGGARLVTGAEVTAITPDGEVTYRHGDVTARVAGDRVLANVAPTMLSRLLGAEPDGPTPEGAQLKVNMVLSRLPRLRDPRVGVTEAFGGTFHVNEGYYQLAAAFAEAQTGRIPSVPPCEIYCHSLTDPSILGPGAVSLHTMTLFGLHMPARLVTGPGDRGAMLAATLASLDAVLAEPIEDCLARDANGEPCVEAKTPLDLEREVGLPGGHIFHRDLSWPYAEEPGTWGVETAHERILLCGAGAIRGGGVSGIPGHNAAMAVLATAR